MKLLNSSTSSQCYLLLSVFFGISHYSLKGADNSHQLSFPETTPFFDFSSGQTMGKTVHYYNLRGNASCSYGDFLNSPKNCPIRFWFEEARILHEAQAHLDEKLEIALCPLCNRLFSNPSAYDVHLMQHCESKPFACARCLLPFKSLETLIVHTCAPQKGLVFSCANCNFEISLPEPGQFHQSICQCYGPLQELVIRPHEQAIADVIEEPKNDMYRCPHCPKKTREVSNHCRHIVAHFCKICNDGPFVKLSKARKHEKKMHPEEWHRRKRRKRS